jgi:hypothetical protein
VVSPKTLFYNRQKRILLLNFEGMSVYKLDGDRLIQEARFSEDPDGLDNFGYYLADHPRWPVILIVDSVAEDFVVETVAHVGVLDRSQFLKRKADQHFRGAEYRSARIVGRLTTGRKEDRVLFSALTKNQAIDPWVRVLLKHEIPIKSITTPAYALCKIASDYQLMTTPSILLVNWEQSGIRQTFIQGDKVLFSRLTPLPYGEDPDTAEAIFDSCVQSKEYLERIGLLEFGASIDVHVITPQLDDDDFQRFNGNRSFSGITHHNSVDMMQISRFGGAQKEITAVLLCVDWGIRHGELGNFYAPAAALRFHHLNQARRLIAVMTLAALALGFLLSSPLLLDAFNRQSTIDQVRAQIAPIQEQYDSLTAQFPATPIPSDAMQVAVSNYNTINSQVLDPSTTLARLGSIIAAYPSVSLSSIEWSYEAKEQEQAFTDALLNESAHIVVDMYGRLRGGRSIQESDRRLRQFMESLGQIDGAEVSAISMPIESRPDAEVSTVLDDRNIDAEFALRISIDSQSTR